MTALPSLVAMIAMVPAALNPSLSLEQPSLDTKLCGSGTALSIPLGTPRLPGTVPSACCAKGCHGKRRDPDSEGSEN